uniref:Signal transduction histidine kinase n=1 Tax=Streptomyces echinatus TaxID=67293 RepID=A1C182_9ACTN|nr:signal transduction histidine kinase [Streptomyces echinatus]
MRGLRRGALVPWWPVLIVVLLQCGLALAGLSAMLGTGATATAVVAWAVLLPPLVVLQVHHTLHGAVLARRRRRWAGVVAQAALTYLPVLVWGVEWPAMAGFAAGSAQAVLNGPAGNVSFAVIVAVAWPVAVGSGLPQYQAATVTAVTAAVGLGVAALMRMAWRLCRLDHARDTAVRDAAHQERLRIARDLHDLVASRLTMAALRGELAERYLTGQDERARAELRTAVELARDALTDVRSLAHGIQTLSLSGELNVARATLRAVGVDVTIRREPCRLAAEVENVLAAALREAVTNLLRHSTAGRCRITVRRRNGQVVLCVANDGVPEELRVPARERWELPRERRGLGNLSGRASAVGGSCTTAVTPDGWFLLTVACPVLRTDPQLRAASPRPGLSGPRRDDCAPRAS